MHFPYYGQFVDYREPFYQVVLLADEIRRRAYERAVNRIVRKGDCVVDLGCGSGILGRFALRAGARKVIAIDRHREMIDMAQFLNEQQFPGAQVRYLVGDASQMNLEEPIDVVVSEFLGGLGDDEGATKILRGFFATNADSSTRVCPMYVDVYAQMAYWNRTEVMRLPERIGETIKVKDECYFYETDARTIRLIEKPMHVARMDGRGASIPIRKWEMRYSPDLGANAVVTWFDAHLTEEVLLTNRPGEPPTSWGHAVIPIPDGVLRDQGYLEIRLKRRGYRAHVEIGGVDGTVSDTTSRP